MILICAATAGELEACPADFAPGAERFVSGVGIPATLITLWNYKATAPGFRRPRLLLNIGIAGAYPDTGIRIGDIVIADSDCYGDVGMEIPGEDGLSRFQPISETAFGKSFYAEPLPATIPESIAMRIGAQEGFTVHCGRGSTVNTCTGTDAVGRRRRQQTGAAFETMEGAAVLQAGQMLGIPVCQIRAISNIAAHRDMRPENIRLALVNLRAYLSGITII
jgi:futalosine hydrolase